MKKLVIRLRREKKTDSAVSPARNINTLRVHLCLLPCFHLLTAVILFGGLSVQKKRYKLLIEGSMAANHDELPVPLFSSLGPVYGGGSQLEEAQHRYDKLQSKFVQVFGHLPDLYARSPGSF